MATTVTLKPNAIDLSGSTSGTTTLQATAVAGTTTITLPAATDTLVGKATTDTLTNKTLTGAVMNGTLGATTPSTVAATTISASSTATFAAGAVGTPSITTTGDTNTGIFFPAADTIAFTKGGAEAMRIDSSGAVFINATSAGSFSAGARLSVLGIDGEFASVVRAPTTANYIVLSCDNPNGQVGKIQTSGSATSFLTSSDYRLKENIAPMTGALAKVALLKPVTYKWKVDGTDGQGFIAHELQEVLPDCVGGDKDATREEQYEVTPAVKDEKGRITTPAVMGTRTVPAYQGIDTSFLVATLTAAIQELSAKNDALTARIVALEAK